MATTLDRTMSSSRGTLVGDVIRLAVIAFVFAIIRRPLANAVTPGRRAPKSAVPRQPRCPGKSRSQFPTRAALGSVRPGAGAGGRRYRHGLGGDFALRFR